MLDGYFDFAAAGVDVFYNSGQVVLTVVRSESGSPTPQAATVDYLTNDNTAIAGVDYGATSGTLSFGPNDTSKTITIPILGVPEIPSVDFGVELSNVQSAEPALGIGSIGAAAVSIVDADVTLTNPGDQTNYQGDSVSIPFTATDAAGYPVTFTAANLPSGLSIDPNTGTISGVIPGDAATGTFAVSVTATDPQYLTSATQSFNLTVNPINHAPVGTDNTVTTFENQPYVFTAADFGFSDPNDTPANNLKAVEITSLPGAGTLSEGGFVSVADINAGDLIFTPANDDNGTPYTSFQFQVQDDGGTDHDGVDTDPSPKTMTINVTWVNQQPSFTASDPPVVGAGSDPVTVSGWASFDPGASNEWSQTGTYTVSNVSNPNLFDVLPAVAPDGTLTYTLAAVASGKSTFDVKVQDDGGTANEGKDTSGIFTFTIQSRPVDQYTVTQGGNSGRGSLRLAVTLGNDPARNASTTFQIGFALTDGNTVGLTSALPNLTAIFNIAGPSTPLTIQGNNNFTIFTITGTTVYMSNLWITGGNAGTGDGGAILNRASTLWLSWVTITGNRAGDSGGGVANTGMGTLELYDTFVDNSTATNLGGGIYNSGGTLLLIEGGSQIAGNTASSGGGLYNGGTAYISSNSNVDNNNAIGGGNTPLVTQGAGGGVYNDATLTMSNAWLTGNTSINQGGGVFSTGSSFFDNTSILGNQATSQANGMGGGIYVNSGLTILSADNIVSGNFGGFYQCLDGVGINTNNGPTFVVGPDDQNDITDPVQQEPS